MPSAAIDTYRFIVALKGTGKNGNFTAEDIAASNGAVIALLGRLAHVF